MKRREIFRLSDQHDVERTKITLQRLFPGFCECRIATVVALREFCFFGIDFQAGGVIRAVVCRYTNQPAACEFITNPDNWTDFVNKYTRQIPNWRELSPLESLAYALTDPDTEADNDN